MASDDGPPGVPQSAGRLIQLMGDSLPPVEDVPAEAFELVARVRDLVEAVVLTDVPAAERAAVAREVAGLTERLRAARRPQPFLIVRHPDGRAEHLTQAGSGRLNPQAPPMEFVDLPPAPPPGTPPAPVEVRAVCTLTAAHSGSTGRAHGSLVAALLDEALGHAVIAAGATGMTVNLSLDFRRATPCGEPLEITARYTGGEGRKSYVTGEIRAQGEVTAEARAIFVRERDAQPGPG